MATATAASSEPASKTLVVTPGLRPAQVQTCATEPASATHGTTWTRAAAVSILAAAAMTPAAASLAARGPVRFELDSCHAECSRRPRLRSRRSDVPAAVNPERFSETRKAATRRAPRVVRAANAHARSQVTSEHSPANRRLHRTDHQKSHTQQRRRWPRLSGASADACSANVSATSKSRPMICPMPMSLAV